MRLGPAAGEAFLRTYAIRACLYALVFLVLLSFGGCRKLKNMMGIGDTIVNPAPGSAEEVVQLLLKAGLDENAERGWASFEALLHTQERGSRGAMSACKRTYWPGFRRKAEFFLVDPASVAYDILEDRAGEHDDYRKIFIRNVASDQPTPVPLKRDKKQEGAWKLAACSL